MSAARRVCIGDRTARFVKGLLNRYMGFSVARRGIICKVNFENSGTKHPALLGYCSRGVGSLVSEAGLGTNGKWMPQRWLAPSMHLRTRPLLKLHVFSLLSIPAYSFQRTSASKLYIVWRFWIVDMGGPLHPQSLGTSKVGSFSRNQSLLSGWIPIFRFETI